MELQFLGTGAGVPSKSRNVSSIALKLLDELNEIWLFDCGEATQHLILNTTLRPRKIKKIFITHLHGDHIFGLPGFLSSRSFQGGDEKLTIYGPKGIQQFVETSIRLSQSKLGYPLEFVEFTDDQLLFDEERFSVSVGKLEHGIDSYGFRIVEKDQPGQLQAQELFALGVPKGPLMGQLKRGEIVTLDNGTVIDGKQYITPDVKGRIIAIFGDTRKNQNEVKLAQDADVLVHEATFEKSEQKLAYRYFHSSTVDAAQLAIRANVKQLYLTHISARYVGYQAKELEKEAQQLFPNTIVVRDYDVFDIPLK